MKKTIAILGSTGSIGKNLIKIIEKNSNDFKVELLSANKNYKEVYKQASKLNVKNIIINDENSYKLALKYNLNKKIKIHNSFNCFYKIISSQLGDIKATCQIVCIKIYSVNTGWLFLIYKICHFITKYIINF